MHLQIWLTRKKYCDKTGMPCFFCFCAGAGRLGSNLDLLVGICLMHPRMRPGLLFKASSLTTCWLWSFDWTKAKQGQMNRLICMARTTKGSTQQGSFSGGICQMHACLFEYTGINIGWRSSFECQVAGTCGLMDESPMARG